MEPHHDKGSSEKDIKLDCQKLLEQIKNIRYADNPQKLSNHQRCVALCGELERVWRLPVRIEAIPGGSVITLRLFWASYFFPFNALLGELIGRSNEFSPSPDPGDPCQIILSMTVFYQDRILNGRLLQD